MASELKTEAPVTAWKARHVYAMAGACLVLGLLLGYLFRDSGSRAATPEAATARPAFASQTSVNSASAAVHPTPTLDQMQQMANTKAAPLLEKLKKDPANAGLLNQIGTIYRATHQFKEAAAYYEKALKVAPNNVAARTDLASCLYYEGDVDAALEQLAKSLQYDPKDANSLFNLGMIRWQGKKDASGAVDAWEQLLKSNPTLAATKQAEVKKLIAQVKQPGTN